MMKKPVLFLLPVVIILLHFGLRIMNSDVQAAYVDEGFHITRAMRVWDFAENPGRFAHGKVLLYFWLGLFEGSNTSTTILPVARMAMAIFSVITASTLFLLARRFAGYWAGILVLLLYAFNPLVVFYERMAMADPLASGLLALTIWRSLVFVEAPHPATGCLTRGITWPDHAGKINDGAGCRGTCVTGLALSSLATKRPFAANLDIDENLPAAAGTGGRDCPANVGALTAPGAGRTWQ